MTQNTWPDWRELPEQQQNRLIILDYVHAMYAEGRADGIPDHWAMIAEADYIEHGFNDARDDDDDDGEEDPGDGIPDHEHTHGKFIGDWLKCQYCGDEWYGWGDPSARILATPRPGGYMERSQSAAHEAMIAAGQCQCDQCRARGLEDQPGEGKASIPVTEPDPISANDDGAPAPAPATATVYAAREGTPLPTTLDLPAGWGPIGFTTAEALEAAVRPTRPIHPATLTDNARPYTMTDQQLRDFIARMKDDAAAAREAMKPRIQVEELNAALRRAGETIGAAFDQAYGRAGVVEPGDKEQ